MSQHISDDLKRLLNAQINLEQDPGLPWLSNWGRVTDVINPCDEFPRGTAWRKHRGQSQIAIMNPVKRKDSNDYEFSGQSAIHVVINIEDSGLNPDILPWLTVAQAVCSEGAVDLTFCFAVNPMLLDRHSTVLEGHKAINEAFEDYLDIDYCKREGWLIDSGAEVKLEGGYQLTNWSVTVEITDLDPTEREKVAVKILNTTLQECIKAFNLALNELEQKTIH